MNYIVLCILKCFFTGCKFYSSILTNQCCSDYLYLINTANITMQFDATIIFSFLSLAIFFDNRKKPWGYFSVLSMRKLFKLFFFCIYTTMQSHPHVCDISTDLIIIFLSLQTRRGHWPTAYVNLPQVEELNTKNCRS